MASYRSIPRLLRSFSALSGRRRLLALEAVAWLLLARVALLVLPFRTIAAWLGAFSAPGVVPAGGAGPLAPETEYRVREIGWVVRRAAHRVPFRAVCLPQGIAAMAMLRRRGIAGVLHFGVARGEDKPLNAHAWLDVCGIEVTGYPVAREFTEVACFV